MSFEPRDYLRHILEEVNYLTESHPDPLFSNRFYPRGLTSRST